MDRWFFLLRVNNLLFREHHNGLKHQKGKFTWPDGSVYEGNFKENIIEGEG